jgi:hypothetical protein
MSVIICPGVHSPELTQGFLEGIGKLLDLDLCIFPSEQLPAYSAFHILDFLGAQASLQALPQGSQLPPWSALKPLVLIGFSAGVVGAMGAAQILQGFGVRVKAVIALDGWGVPLWGNFPIHRISHDRFTDWSSPLWGRQDSSFYAEPEVAHLDLWRSPQTAQGWAIEGGKATLTTAAAFVQRLLIHYQEAEIT